MQEISGEARERLLKIFDAVNQWRAWTGTAPPAPATGSSLAKDDEVTAPYQISHAVAGAMVSAVDHLDAVRALVQDAQVLHARAPYTLLRAALENAATAVWLLAPANRNERVLRRLRLQWADVRDGQKAHREVGIEPAPSQAGWQAKIEAVAHARGLAEEQVRDVTRKNVTYSEIVKTAGAEARNVDPVMRHALFCWMISSGIAHAKPWAVLSAVLDRKVVPEVKDPSASQLGLRLSASDDAVTVIAGFAASMASEGWRLLDERRTGPSATRPGGY